jgi:hypothetical protein
MSTTTTTTTTTTAGTKESPNGVNESRSGRGESPITTRKESPNVTTTTKDSPQLWSWSSESYSSEIESKDGFDEHHGVGQ